MKNNKYGMPAPANRAEFEHNISLAIERANEKIKNNQLDPFFMSRTIPNLQKLHFLPNDRINLLSVDESLRLESNMLHWMEISDKKPIKEE